MGGFFVFLLWVAIYVFFAVCIKRIAEKTGQTEKSWYAWVPIANAILLCWIAGKPAWWVILMLIPFVNIVIGIIVWMKVAQACSKPAWLGVVIGLVPIVNFFAMGYLAFSK
jgi:hypothetical protein